MKRKNKEPDQIELLKIRYRQRITEQEDIIKSSFHEFTNNITGVTLFKKVKDNLFSGSGFAFRLGFMAVNLLRKKLAQRKTK